MSVDTLDRPRDGAATGAQAKLSVIDCDIHPMLRSAKSLHPYLSTRWRDFVDSYGPHTRLPFLGSPAYPKATPALSRRDSWPPNGGPPGSDLDFMREQHLDPNGVEYGILQVLYPAVKDQRNLEFAAALARAVNDWQVEEWARPEPRLKASISLPCEDPEAAVAEIERRAGDKHFAQIFLTARTSEPLGRKRYWPIFEAAARHGIPIGIHSGGANGVPLTPGGWHSFYIEDHFGNAVAMQTALASIVFEGVPERWPDLKIVAVEAGFGWVPSWTWRMDRQWARFRDEVPHVAHPPSTYIKRNIWFSTQPIEETDRRRDLRDTLDWVGYDRIVFATDYPHWDFDDPRYAFKVALTDEQQRSIFTGNARAVYGLA